MSDQHDVPVRPLTDRESTRRSHIAAVVVAAGLVAIVSVGLLGPRVAPTASLAPAVVPVPGPSEGPVATVRATPAVRQGMVCLPAPRPFDPTTFDLSGIWTGVDGGVYFMSQLGSAVWWNGLSDWDGASGGLGAEWTSVGHGTIDGLMIAADWAEGPNGNLRVGGSLTLEIQDNGQGNIQIVTRGQSGGFGNTLWLPATCRPL